VRISHPRKGEDAMTTRGGHFHVETIFGSHTTGFLSFIVVAAFAGLAMVTPATATPINYVLNPPVTGGGATAVGGFTFDATGPTLDAVDLIVTGGPQPGSYTVPVSATSTEILAEIPATADMILLIFANPLGTAADPVTAVAFPPSARDPAPAMGDAVPTPEPTSLALLGGALGLFLLVRGVNRRASQS
jgi:hypothetical protein